MQMNYCKEFEKRNKTVVLGGEHPTILPDEALRYADSVVMGETESVWQSILLDFQNKKLTTKYHNSNADMNKYSNRF